MALTDTLRQWVLGWLLPEEYMDTGYRQEMTGRQEKYLYYGGTQKRQIQPKPGQADDNITTNYIQLVVERSLSLLLGGGVTFDVDGEGDSEEQQYVDALWQANKGDILLHRAGQHAGIVGTGYLKIIPGYYAVGGRDLPRLIALDSRYMSIETMPDDMDVVALYKMRYNISETAANGQRETVAKQELTRLDPDNPNQWLIEYWENRRSTAGKWVLVETELWPFPFPPIVHWQNLPATGVYGRSDIEDIIELQDRINFVSSNISKIIRYHAHPKTWGRNINLGNNLSWGGDEMVTVNGDTAMIANLEMQSDLSSSMAYLLSLRQSLFDITRTVDISSMADKVGALTNFGLRVLYGDALAKLSSKQALMGEALEQANGRMLVMAGYTEPPLVKTVWPDNLPRDENQDMMAQSMELKMGTVSKQTIATENGRDWEVEKARMDSEKEPEPVVQIEGLGYAQQRNGDN